MRGCKIDTLAFQGSRLGLTPHDFSAASLEKVVAHLDRDMADNRYALFPAEEFASCPETDALKFYLLNHVNAIVSQRVHPLEPLGKYLLLVEQYHYGLAVMSTRMFYYLLLICTRESRHTKNTGSYSSGVWQVVRKPHSAEVFEKLRAFHHSLLGNSSSMAVDRLRSSPPEVTLGSYTRFLVDVFNHGTYSSGYGGKAWGRVATVLHRYVAGEISAEAMMDTAFTLCHNNGPIFNKGMLFSNYSHDIYKILDVQRSGQIPQLIASKGVSAAVNQAVRVLWDMAHNILGAEVEGTVDWYKVEALGALKTYTAEKKAQNPAMAPIAHPTKKVATSKPIGLEIMPGVYVPNVKVRA